MKRKSMKQVLAAVMSAAMVMGMPMAALAAEGDADAGDDTSSGGVEADVPIYILDVENVIVPTSMVVAFNPDELEVKTGTDAADKSDDQVVSRSFGILNKSSKDKIVTITFQVEDLNTDKITFVDTDALATGADQGEYAVHLTMVPADTTEVKVGAGASAAAATKDTAADDLADVAMTAAAAGKEVTLTAGDNEVMFLLQKATYTSKATDGLELGSVTGNDVTANFDLTAVAAGGKGITAFQFGGALNKKADWAQLTQGIKITAVYDFETTYEYDTLAAASGGAIAAGTGAMLGAVAPSVVTTNFAILEAGKDAKINVDLGRGSLKASDVAGIEWNGVDYLGNPYTYENGVVTIPAASVDYFLSDSSASRVFKIIFDDEAATSVTVTLTEKP